jgi:hypothetical protein
MDLSSMFQNLGPAGGAILTGMQAGDAANEQKSMQAYRQAQMEDILQKTSQQAEMHPLELQSKKQLIEKGTQDLEKGKVDLEKSKFDLTVGKLEGAVKKADFYSQLMGVAAAQLANIPVKAPGDPSRHNFLANFAKENGIDTNDPAVKSVWQQTSQIPPDKLPQALDAFRNKIIQQSAAYRSHIDGLRVQGQNQKDIEGMRETAKAKLQAEKGSLEKSLQQDLSAARTYQAQSVVYGNHAAKARLRGDTEEATRLEALSKEANIKDLQKSAAAGDAQAAQKLQALQMVMGGGGVPNAPAAPASSAAPAGPVSGTTKSGAKFTVTPTQE